MRPAEQAALRRSPALLDLGARPDDVNDGCLHAVMALVLADGTPLELPASIEVTVVGDTGSSPTRVTSWPIEVVRRAEWLAAAERQSA